MRNTQIALAVAGIMAASGASAASYTVYASGASAQRTFWEQDLNFVCTGSRTTPTALWTVNKVLNPSTGASVALPDIEAAQCTVTASGKFSAPIVVGDVLTLQYAAELGSVWGIAPFISNNTANVTGRRFLNLTGGQCPAGGGVCTVVGYDRTHDTQVSGALGSPVHPDLGLTDIEATKWVAVDNWPADLTNNVQQLSIPILGDNTNHKQPTAAQIAAYVSPALPATYTRINGQVLSIIVNNTTGPQKNLTNLSVASARAIFTGQLATWGQVPEINNPADATNIIVCRRDHGSGTEVTASIFLTGTECGVSGALPIVSQANGPNDPAVIANLGGTFQVLENSTTGDLTACVTSNAGAIGIRSLSFNTSYVTLKLDGVEGNAHNAASGAYGYAFDAWLYDPGNQAAGPKAVITSLKDDAQLQTNLAAEPGGLQSGLWVAGTGNSQGSKGAIAGSYGLGNDFPVSISTDWQITTGRAPESGWDTAGESCSVKIDLFAP
jgi:hypothetical protein